MRTNFTADLNWNTPTELVLAVGETVTYGVRLTVGVKSGKLLPTENLLEDTDGLLLLSHSADVRSSDDVIAFLGGRWWPAHA